MEWKDFRKLSTQEKRYKVEQTTDLSLDCDLRERALLIGDVVRAKNGKEYIIAIAMLEIFEASYR